MKKEHQFYAWTAGISTVVLIAAFVIPGEPTDPHNLPWRFEHPSPEQLSVFGLTLGVNNTSDAEQRFQEEGKPNIFKSRQGDLVAEVFFNQVILVGLKSKVVLSIDVPKAELEEMYQQGIRMAGTMSGKKITPSPEDVNKIRSYPISSITYMPAANVPPDTFIKRFGEPSLRIKEKESGVMHWLYPNIALDIAFGENDRPVLQYVAPNNFERLRKPLEEHGEPAS